MHNKELQDYLKQWPDEAEVSITVVDFEKKRAWGADNYELIFITDAGKPVMFLRISGDGEDISAEIEEAANDDN